MVKPTPQTITAKTCSQIIDTISFIRPQRIRFTTHQSIPCHIQKPNTKITSITLSHSSKTTNQKPKKKKKTKLRMQTQSPSFVASPAATVHSGVGSDCDPSFTRPYRSIVRTKRGQKGRNLENLLSLKTQNERFR